jgi:hypothetical protein
MRGPFAPLCCHYSKGTISLRQIDKLKIDPNLRDNVMSIRLIALIKRLTGPP